MVKEAEKLGLLVMDEDREVFELMGNTDVVIETRYIRTGLRRGLPAKRWIALAEVSARAFAPCYAKPE